MAVVTSVAGVVFSRPILSFLNTPDNVIDEAVAYINVIFAFTIGTAMYNASSAILRSLGDSRTPLYALILSSVLNVVFDLLFVVVFKTGVVGAAVATVIAQIISAIYCIIHMVRHRRQLNLEGINFQTTKRAIKRIFQTGIPSALESCLISLGTMSVQRLVNSFGAMTMAGYTAAAKIDSIAIAPIVSVGSALSVFSGQNIGANQMDRIKKGMYQTLASLIGICIGTMESHNVLTVAWTGVLATHPPMTYISVRPTRHSYGILMEQREFVINLTTSAMMKETDFCGVRSGKDVDKFQVCHFTPEPAQTVQAPLIAECPVNLESP